MKYTVWLVGPEIKDNFFKDGWYLGIRIDPCTVNSKTFLEQGASSNTPSLSFRVVLLKKNPLNWRFRRFYCTFRSSKNGYLVNRTLVCIKHYEYCTHFTSRWRCCGDPLLSLENFLHISSLICYFRHSCYFCQFCYFVSYDLLFFILVISCISGHNCTNHAVELHDCDSSQHMH